MKKYLCYQELHIEDKTFFIHLIIEANSKDEALGKVKSEHGKSYHLQAKGCIGEFTEKLAFEYMNLSEMYPEG